MANTNSILELVCDIIMTVFAVLTGLVMCMFGMDISGAAWGSNVETPEFWHASTWSEECMCACDWTTGSGITEVGMTGKTLALDSCSLSDFEVLRGCMYRIRKEECEDDGKIEPYVAWDCGDEDALFGPPTGKPWNNTDCGGPGSCQKWIDVMTREWDDGGPFDGAPGDPPQSGHVDFSEACANSGWLTFIHSGSAIFTLFFQVPIRIAYVLLIWGLGTCINLQKKDRKITMILLITDTVLCLFWFHIMFGQVLFRMVGFPSINYPRGPSTISINLAIPTWIGWFQWSYGWIRDDEGDSDSATVKEDEEKSSG